MSENPTAQKLLATIWRVPDELWERIDVLPPILNEHDPPKIRQRPPAAPA
jgi:hypothetical protein